MGCADEKKPLQFEAAFLIWDQLAAHPIQTARFKNNF
ncbi:MAG: hypothetical protein ACJA1Y_000750 [Burkholderiaceae bacterium]|jgi:hypothetical protein|tara:strand:- start:973 stop:1083 length:111 start_codon:yes stop_codon:yes gene_type:complete